MSEQATTILPVDVHAIMNAIGVDVREQPDVENSGTIFWDETQQRWSVVLRAQESWVRKRYTLAHELGHYILHLENGARKDLAPLHRPTTKSVGHIEREANQFAADLLMPEYLVRGLWQDGYRVESMAAKFLVSKAAMSWRLHDLGLQRIS